MQHCLNKRRHHETFTDEPEEFEEELQTRDSSPQKERQSNTDTRWRAPVKYSDEWYKRFVNYRYVGK